MDSVAGGHFKCRVKAAAWRRRFRDTRKSRGQCIQCGDPLDTTTLCRPCADDHADLMAQPDRYLKHLFVQARHRKRARAAEGLEPSGVLRRLLEEGMDGQV